MAKQSASVCLTPELIHLHDLQDKLVVVTDILRATSCMTTAFAYGVKEIIPVATVEECRDLQSNGFICAAERGGQKVEGFELDNSPFSYMDPKLKGTTIAVTTTNGTLAITKSAGAHRILIGAFLNLSALADYIRKQSKDVIIHCAGWKGKVNMEDSLFAGALLEKIASSHDIDCDAAHLALRYYISQKDDITSVVYNSSHAKRLQKFNITKDIDFCLELDKFDVIPHMKDDRLVLLEDH